MQLITSNVWYAKAQKKIISTQVLLSSMTCWVKLKKPLRCCQHHQSNFSMISWEVWSISFFPVFFQGAEESSDDFTIKFYKLPISCWYSKSKNTQAHTYTHSSRLLFSVVWTHHQMHTALEKSKWWIFSTSMSHGNIHKSWPKWHWLYVFTKQFFYDKRQEKSMQWGKH
jgi:hypothetical protein